MVEIIRKVDGCDNLIKMRVMQTFVFSGKSVYIVFRNITMIGCE